jgi:hypothetical protein
VRLYNIILYVFLSLHIKKLAPKIYSSMRVGSGSVPTKNEGEKEWNTVKGAVLEYFSLSL